MSNSSRIYRKDPSEIEVPRRVLAARLGFKGIGDVPKEFEEYLEKAWRVAMEVAEPVAIYDHFPVRDFENGIEVAGRVLAGRSVDDFVKGSKEVTLMVGTLGGGFDEAVSEFHEKGEELLSFFLDGIGSELVEYFVRSLDGKLREEKGTGGPRISPGYGDLPLSLNVWIVETLGADAIGVSCDPETYVMKPRKTISALIGWR